MTPRTLRPSEAPEAQVVASCPRVAGPGITGSRRRQQGRTVHSSVVLAGPVTVPATLESAGIVVERSLIDVGSFLMKGEEVRPHQRWHGNPAKPMWAVAPTSETAREPMGGVVSADAHSSPSVPAPGDDPA